MMPDLTPDILLKEFSSLRDWQSQYRYLMQLGNLLPSFPIEAKNVEHLIQGCEAPVWLCHTYTQQTHHFLFDSEAKIIRGLLMILLIGIQNQPTTFITHFDFATYLQKLGLARHLSTSRTNGLQKIWAAVQEKILEN